MKKEITAKQKWYVIDGNYSTEYIPYDLVSDISIHPDAIEIPDELKEYTENTEAYAVPRIIEGYGVRLSAPGYLDCTDWVVFNTKKEALKYKP